MKRLKNYLLIIGIIMTLINVASVSAQPPDFRIALIDSTYYGVKNLNKTAPVLFMYFSPSCDECHKMTSAILYHIGDLKNIQIVMITNESLIEVRKFVTRFRLDKYKNMIVGTEGYTNRFLKIFQVGKLPFLVYYDKKGKFIMTYNDTIPVNFFVLDVLKSSNQ